MVQGGRPATFKRWNYLCWTDNFLSWVDSSVLSVSRFGEWWCAPRKFDDWNACSGEHWAEKQELDRTGWRRGHAYRFRFYSNTHRNICPIAHNNFLIDTCLVAILYFFLFMFSFFVYFTLLAVYCPMFRQLGIVRVYCVLYPFIILGLEFVSGHFFWYL